jgi:hypothetical protein
LDEVEYVHGLETMLWSDKFKIAGSIDLIATFKNKLSIIDFKNSGKLRKDEYNETYYIQTLLYAFMVYERYGLMPQQSCLFVSIRRDDNINSMIPPYQLFTKSIKELMVCAKPFLERYLSSELFNGYK